MRDPSPNRVESSASRGMRRSDVLDAITEVAADQAGYVSTAQMARLGVKAARLSLLGHDGDLRRVRHGIYALRGTTHAQEETLAAWLALEGATLPWQRRSTSPRAVLSHRSAAAHWDLGTILPGAPAFTIRGYRPQLPGIEVHSAGLDASAWEWRQDGAIDIPVTTVARTIVDLVLAREETGYVRRALQEATRDGLTDAGRLERALALRTRSGPARAVLHELGALG